jgi:hypothetical protein
MKEYKYSFYKNYFSLMIIIIFFNLVCVRENSHVFWLLKELNINLSKNNCFYDFFLYFLFVIR